MPGFPAYISIDPASSLSGTTATITGIYGPDGDGYDVVSPITLYYGLTLYSTTYSASVSISGGTFSHTLTGLANNTTYYLYAHGWNGLVNVYSDSINFDTLGTSSTQGGMLFFT